MLLLIAIVGLLVLVGIVRYLRRSRHHSSPRSSGRIVIDTAVTFIGVLALLCNLWAVRMQLAWYAWARADKDAVEHKQRELLYQTDHLAILKAGRLMLSDSNAYPSYLGTNSLPKHIRDLNPSCVSIDTERSAVRVEMGGGFFHFGFSIYRDGEAGSGAKQIIPGLWYYSEDGEVILPK